MSTDETIIDGVGNVFDDLGMPDAAAERKQRACRLPSSCVY
jgi:hypothetical protein